METEENATRRRAGRSMATQRLLAENVALAKVMTCWIGGQPPSSDYIQHVRSYVPELGDLPRDGSSWTTITESRAGWTIQPVRSGRLLENGVFPSDDNSGTHPCAADIRKYALSTLLERKSAVLQQHLLVCLQCRKRLYQTVSLIHARHCAGIEGRTLYAGDHLECWSVHYVGDDLITSVAIRLRKNKWAVRLSGPRLDAGATTESLEDAQEYLVDSFRRIFPAHECTKQCESYGMAQLFLVGLPT